MSKLSRVTQKVFGSTAGFQQIAQFGSLQAGTPTFTTNIATIQALSNYLVGWFNAVIGQNSPAIEDMNALFYLITTQMAYEFQQGIPEWDSGTTYYAGSLVNYDVFIFTVTSANATIGATYTNNSQTFTVQATIAAGTRLICTGTGIPTASGTLTKASGTGDATIAFSAKAPASGIYVSITDTNLNNALTDTTNWQPVVPILGKALQHAVVNSSGTGTQYSYSNFNAQTADVSLDVAVGFNLNTGNLIIPSGITYTVEGSAVCGTSCQITGTGSLQVTGSGSFRVN